MNYQLNHVLLRIDELCKKHNMNHYRLAKNAGIPLSSLNSMFHRNTMPTIATLEKLCDAMGITLLDFFSYTKPENTNLVSDYTVTITIPNDPKTLHMIGQIQKLFPSQRELLSQYIDLLSQVQETPEKGLPH